MKKIFCIFLATVLFLCGCGSNQDKSVGVAGDSSQEDVSIGMCFDTFTIERWLKDRDVFTYTATELGEKVEVQNANGDVKKQREQIKHFIDIGVKAIVIIAVDADSIVDLVKEAHDEGIKVIAYDRLIEGTEIDLYISFDNEMVGQYMAEAIESQLAQKECKTRNVLMLCGPNSDKNVESVSKGFCEFAQKNNFNIVDTFNAEGWRAENVDKFFEENPGIEEKVDAIMCGNDSLAGEVIQILSAKRLAGKIVVTGQDADLDACQRIVEGTQGSTVFKQVEQQAKLAAEYTVSMIKGEKITSVVTDTIDNGNCDVPFYALQPISVDKSNMDEIIIESGFHLKEDVYRNVADDVFLNNKK